MADNDDLVSLAAELGAALKNRGHVLALAESCTGGWAAQCVTAIPGSSAWFDRGFVTYSNAAKQEMLGVEGHTISSSGAVSAEKPVGTVCFAWASRTGEIRSVTEHYSGSREEVRRQSVKTALSGLLQLTLNLDL